MRPADINKTLLIAMRTRYMYCDCKEASRMQRYFSYGNFISEVI